MNELRKAREKSGVVCSVCGGINHYWNKCRKSWVCKDCHHETTLTSGTIMHGSKLPLLIWFTAIHLITSTKNSFSALEIMRQLGVKRYQPVWEMLHKIRSVMGLRDDRYKLEDEVEIDECFVTSENSEQGRKDEPLKRGSGSQRKTKVLVMIESKKSEPKHKTDKSRKVNHIKMKVIGDLKSETIKDNVSGHVDPEAKAVMDASKSHSRLDDVLAKTTKVVVPPQDAPKVLPWVHIAISNAKSIIQNLYHGIKDDFVQYYLDEYCWKFNRRYMHDKLFDRFLIAAISYQPTFTHRLYGTRTKLSADCGFLSFGQT